MYLVAAFSPTLLSVCNASFIMLCLCLSHHFLEYTEVYINLVIKVIKINKLTITTLSTDNVNLHNQFIKPKVENASQCEVNEGWNMKIWSEPHGQWRISNEIMID